MRVLSVNVASSGTVEVRGRDVPTGIFKLPVRGPRLIETTGLHGDFRIERRKLGETDHALHAYAHEHYAYWERRLERPPFPFGQFGENLTVIGLLETGVRVGDVFRFGTALLQVTSPRVPCRKLDVRMDRPGFKRMFLTSRRVGFYLRVLEPGRVAAGDSIQEISTDPDSPTLDEFTRVSQIDYWDADGLEHLLRGRDLSPAWRDLLNDKLERARRAERWFGERELEVVHRHEESVTAVSLLLRCARGKPLPPAGPGDILTLVMRDAGGGAGRRRRAPLSEEADLASGYRITARLTEGDGLDEWLARLRPGDRLRALAPRAGAARATQTPER